MADCDQKDDSCTGRLNEEEYAKLLNAQKALNYLLTKLTLPLFGFMTPRLAEVIDATKRIAEGLPPESP